MASFNHLRYMDKFLSDFKAGVAFANNSTAKVNRFTSSGPHYQLIGIYHLTGDENRSKHNLYMDVVDINGHCIGEKIEWGWEGQKPTQQPNPVILDKPPNEPAGNIVIFWGQKIWARVLGKPSDTIVDVHSMLPDEDVWNTLGHHSFYCVWLWNKDGTAPPPIDPPIDPPPSTGSYKEGYDAGAGNAKGLMQEVLDNL